MGWNSYVKLANHVRSEKGNVCGMIKEDRIATLLHRSTYLYCSSEMKKII